MDTSQLDTAELYRLLETVEDPAARYHIRNAIQYAIALEEHGRLGPQRIPASEPDTGTDLDSDADRTDDD
ncbi:hypothetical protein [Haloglomus salinum]|jgi:hypothetical protein|uniref:hypothetical protein n=1 Tax=Haloglomus salinum TaxID=2962673 RepID=UPI0020C9987A|nr:hypothetical protein [Haloglomus salinum]